jgi:hypothetical protein
MAYSASNRNEYQKQKNYFSCEGWPEREANITDLCEPIIQKMWDQHLTAL